MDRALLSACVEPASATGLAVYVCGPDPFLRAVTGHLRDLGLPRRAIHAETFSCQPECERGTESRLD